MELTPISEIKSRYVEQLRTSHVKKSKLDLHGLDHLSAKLLLQEFLTPEKLRTGVRVVFGASSHSKTSSKGKMKNIVSNYIDQLNLSATKWEGSSVTLTLTEQKQSVAKSIARTMMAPPKKDSSKIEANRGTQKKIAP